MSGTKRLSAEDILNALRHLSNELGMQAQRGELVLVGGAAISLTLGNREATRDVDGYIRQPAEAAVMREAARRVASKLDLPEDWLNDAAKGFMHHVDLGECVLKTDHLTVYSASATQLLAMKLWAWRDEQDIQDASRLLKVLTSPETANREETWAKVEAFLPDDAKTKASYAFDDLWEAVFADGNPEV